MPKETAYIHTSAAAIVSSEASIETLIDKSGNGGKGDPPSAKELHALHDKIRETVLRFMGKRGEVCDRSMRQLAQKRKERLARERELEIARAEQEAAAARVKREEQEAGEGVVKKKKGVGRKRSREEMEVDEEGRTKEEQERRESLPSVGAHGVARQDGVRVHEGVSTVCAFIPFDVLRLYAGVATSLLSFLSLTAGMDGYPRLTSCDHM